MDCTNYCDSCGNCSRCGQCCAASIPLTRKEEKRIREYIKQNEIEPEVFQTETDMNLQCCFYDRKKKMCKIYEVRPSICRSFKCNRALKELLKERDINHEKAYWNNITNGEESHLTDMRLLFYDDPRSLIGNILFRITDGTMKVTKDDFEFMKNYLRNNGQAELANCIEGSFINENNQT